MVERKPSHLNFESWIDKQIREATERGEFENLPGAGQPIPGAGTPVDEDWWLRDYVRREGVTSDVLLPPSLLLRRDIERLPETVRELSSEARVRAAVSELNERIVRWLRMPEGPVVPIRPVDADDVVAEWKRDRGEPAGKLGTPRTDRSEGVGRDRLGKPDGSGQAHPVKADGSREVRPLNADGSREVRPLNADGSREVRPLNADGSREVRPLNADGSREVRPLNADGSREVRPLNADGSGEVRPMKADSYGEVCPAKADGSGQVGSDRTDSTEHPEGSERAARPSWWRRWRFGRR